ncbi:preprotein translocase, SecE subunit [Tolumonas auensis DSM 9187]|jgi:preprotein translocase subunit SecE|uniref:Protein translocase subunit SecE n=1 Tax=Tolumonas auensis (strain DSM 9187 / NBRC 110442 / TA 4) TaxID=595494 RepID=C4LBV8_TOLAT|nr:preprotein translocase subunit SecE [Tolumonas auensis]ACQ94382.1 preprotein translocase, SecE subunit [Tolumonas auensis DSM 9187]
MSVNVESQNRNKGKNIALWGLVFILLAAAVVGNSVFAEKSLLIRVVAVVIAFAAAAVTALQTIQGKALLTFSRESIKEVRKVVWPTRQETIQTTLIIFAFTVVMGLFLFLIDGALIWLVELITGMKG